MIDREELERLHEAGAVTLNECPPGLFMFGHCLGFKSEYVTTLENPRRYQVDAYVVASGEYFHGGARGTEQRGNLVVQPLDCETIATLLTERDTLAAENAALTEKVERLLSTGGKVAGQIRVMMRDDDAPVSSYEWLMASEKFLDEWDAALAAYRGK